MSFPDKNRVEFEEHAWMANVAEEDAMEASITVTTLEKVSLFNAKRDTAIDGYQALPRTPNRSGNAREFLSSPKNSVRRSSEAKRSSLRLSFFPRAEELVSVSSRAMTTTGTGVAVFAVFGLYTRVLINSNDSGTELVASKASRQDAGELVSAWDTVAVGVIERDAREAVKEDIVDVDRRGLG